MCYSEISKSEIKSEFSPQVDKTIHISNKTLTNNFAN